MITQGAIFLLGLVAVWLSQDPSPRYAKWACVFGLASQPFWLYATFMSAQWGMFALSVVYVFAWLRGVKTYWWSRA